MAQTNPDFISIEGLKVNCIIGVFDWERTTLQKVAIDLELPCDAKYASKSDRIEHTLDYKKISKAVASFVESSSFHLLETLAESVARYSITTFGLERVKVRVSKPGALRGAENVSVTVERRSIDYGIGKQLSVYLSIGSNIEPNRFVAQAVRELHGLLEVVRVSHIYETEPYGAVVDQPLFWNMAMEARTAFPEDELKQKLMRLEENLGRIRTEDKFSSRTIDLDILIYSDKWNFEREAVSEISLVEQAHILIPLAEIAPSLTEPLSGKKLMELLAERAYEGKNIRCLGPWQDIKIEEMR